MVLKLGFLKKQIKSQKRGNVFFTNIRKTRRREIEKRKSEYEWGFPDYKIYPSALCLGMCPKDYILSLENWNGIGNLDAIYRVKRGSAVHKEFQKDFLLSDRIYAPPKNIFDERILKKLDKEWPEVPFHCKETGVSGSIDAVINWDGPVPVEIKTTSIEPSRWNQHVEKNLPYMSHITQIGSYIWYLNRLGYYREPVTRGILAYNNLLFSPGIDKAELEFVIDESYIPKGYTESLNDLVEDLILNGVSKCRMQYIQTGRDSVECTYSKCKKCRKTDSGK